MSKENYLTQCPGCGSTEFYVFEETIHEGDIDEETGVLLCHNGEAGGIKRVVCKECDKHIDAGRFSGVQFV